MLRKIRSMQDVKPRNHARKVMTGRVGSSVSGTTKATSSTGLLSSFSVASAFGFSGSIRVLVGIEAGKIKERQSRAVIMQSCSSYNLIGHFEEKASMDRVFLFQKEFGHWFSFALPFFFFSFRCRSLLFLFCSSPSKMLRPPFLSSRKKSLFSR